MSKDLTKTNIGNSGEYFVLAELERRGFEAAVLGNNCKDFDIIAYYIKTCTPIFIQVKTTEGYKKEGKRKTNWTLSNNKVIMDNMFYILVDLNSLNNPTYHIAPSEDVVNFKEKFHKEYLKNEKHKDTNMRIFKDDDNKYLNRWDIIIDFCKKGS